MNENENKCANQGNCTNPNGCCQNNPGATCCRDKGLCPTNDPMTQQEREHNAFIREVKSEMHKERIANLWKKWRYVIIGGASAAIIITAVFGLNRYFIDSDGKKFAQLYEEALTTTDTDARIAALSAVAKGSRHAFGDMAYQQLVAAQIAAGRESDAAKTLVEAFGKARTPEFRSVSAIKLSQLSGYVATDDGFKQAVSLLSQIRARDPLYFSAQLALASLWASRGEADKAFAALGRIDKSAPPSVAQFAGAMASSLSK